MKNKYIIGFDFDGVLIDSLELMEKSWNNVKFKYNLNPEFKDYKKHIGIPFFEILRKIGIEESSTYKDIRDTYFEFNFNNKKHVKLYNGVKELFMFLKEKEYETFIITSKSKKNTLDILNMFNLEVDRLVTPDDVNLGKPNKESMDKMKSYFKSNNILYIGDMETDRIFSINSSVDFIYAKYGYGELKSNNNVIFELDNLRDLITFLK